MELNEKVMIFIVLVSEMFKKKSSAILRQHGLTFSHYNVLKHLAACGHDGDTVGNVSKKMLVTPANMTSLAKRMERAALIEKGNDPGDQRFTVLRITPKGLEVLDATRGIQEGHGVAYLKSYSREQKEEVLAILKHIVRQGKEPGR